MFLVAVCLNNRHSLRRPLRSRAMRWLLGAVLAGTAVVVLAPPANADEVAYLVNVHVRPGYNFPNADAAIGYGNSICDRVAAKMSYGGWSTRSRPTSTRPA